MGSSGQVCVVRTVGGDDYTQVAVGSVQNTFHIHFLPKPQFCHLQNGCNDNNNIMKSHLVKGLGYNKLTTLGESTIQSPLTITYGIEKQTTSPKCSLGNFPRNIKTEDFPCLKSSQCLLR